MRKYIRILLSVLTVLLCLSAAAACAGTQSEERPEETERPVAIEKLTLSYEQITYDPEYAEISGVDYDYEPRNTEDFQIGRLVRVVPEITPLDASYKTLNYTVTKGAEYIQDFETYEEGGITYAQFRVKNDAANIGKAVQISATSNGYTGEYADYNVTGTSEKDLIITEIPADDFALGIQENGALQEMGTLPHTVYIGETYVFEFIAASIVPSNATLAGGGVRYDDVYVKRICMNFATPLKRISVMRIIMTRYTQIETYISRHWK